MFVLPNEGVVASNDMRNVGVPGLLQPEVAEAGQGVGGDGQAQAFQ